MRGRLPMGACIIKIEIEMMTRRVNFSPVAGSACAVASKVPCPVPVLYL